MLFHSLAIILLTTLSMSVLAEEAKSKIPETTNPLMTLPPAENEDFNQKNSFSVDKTKAIKGNQSPDNCQTLLKKADELKGRPQRRWAAMERYRIECQQNTQPKYDNESF